MNKSLLYSVIPICLLSGCYPTGGDIAINEVLAKSDSTADWIELYNFGPTEVQLANWSIGDNITEDLPWELPDISLEAGEFLIIWASAGEGTEDGLHCDFKLAREGETLHLFDPSNEIIDQVTYPVLGTEQSYGRTIDGTGEWSILVAPSPGDSNVWDVE